VNHAGREAEQAALAYLQERGLRLLRANYHCRFGEIDLVMQEGAELVFVEVRQRGRSDFGSAAESITPQKQKKLTLAAQHYLASHGDAACRFDAMLCGSDTRHFEWIRNAFQPA